MTRCETARRWMDERLDGEISSGDAVELEVHLGDCEACRDNAICLQGVVQGLGQLPLETMPEHDLESVLRRTVGAASANRETAFTRRTGPDAMQLAASRRWVRSPYVLAAAAMLAAIAIVPFAFRSSAPPEPSRAEIEVAAQEARMVLALASRAVRSAESTARDRVIAGEVAPALKRVPLRWHHDPASRRNGA